MEEQELIFRSVNSHGQCINCLNALLHINVSCAGYVMKLEELLKARSVTGRLQEDRKSKRRSPWILP